MTAGRTTRSFTHAAVLLRRAMTAHFAQLRSAHPAQRCARQGKSRANFAVVSVLSETTHAPVRTHLPHIAARWSPENAGAGNVTPPAKQYVFLLELPRPGTMLPELILSSHPMIETMEVCSCLDDAHMEQFTSRARDKFIDTPSVAQVARGPYAGAQDSWRNYRNQMTPILPKLSDWMSHHGYAVGRQIPRAGIAVRLA